MLVADEWFNGLDEQTRSLILDLEEELAELRAERFRLRAQLEVTRQDRDRFFDACFRTRLELHADAG